MRTTPALAHFSRADPSKKSVQWGSVKTGALISGSEGPALMTGPPESVCLKVVAQFPGRNKYCIDKLMRLKIPGLCLVKDFADVVDWLLDGPDPGDRVRLALIHHVRSLGPSGSGFPLGRGCFGPPCQGSGPSDRGEADGPPCPGSGSPSCCSTDCFQGFWRTGLASG